MEINPGRFTRARVHNEAGEIEVWLSEGGNWQLKMRGEAEREWRMACSGDLTGGATAAPEVNDARPVRLGSLLLDRAARRALVGEAEIQLTGREFELLATLAARPNRVFSKEELLRDVWGYQSLGRTRTLDTHASRLRVKLREAGADGLIVNCWGVGYQLWKSTHLAAAADRTAA